MRDGSTTRVAPEFATLSIRTPPYACGAILALPARRREGGCGRNRQAAPHAASGGTTTTAPCSSCGTALRRRIRRTAALPSSVATLKPANHGRVGGVSSVMKSPSEAGSQSTSRPLAKAKMRAAPWRSGTMPPRRRKRSSAAAISATQSTVSVSATARLGWARRCFLPHQLGGQMLDQLDAAFRRIGERHALEAHESLAGGDRHLALHRPNPRRGEAGFAQPRQLRFGVIDAESHDVHAMIARQELAKLVVVERWIDDADDLDIALFEHGAAIGAAPADDRTVRLQRPGLLLERGEMEAETLVGRSRGGKIRHRDADMVETVDAGAHALPLKLDTGRPVP